MSLDSTMSTDHHSENTPDFGRPTDVEISEGSVAILTDAQRVLGVSPARIHLDNSTWKFTDEREAEAVVDAKIWVLPVRISVPRARLTGSSAGADNPHLPSVTFRPIHRGATAAWESIRTRDSLRWYMTGKLHSRRSQDMKALAAQELETRAEQRAAAEEFARELTTAALLETHNTAPTDDSSQRP